MTKLRVLVGCEYSGVVRDAFIRRGHDAMSCDLLPTESPGPHHQGDVLELIARESFDLMIAHPPCTYLANSGSRWLFERPEEWPGSDAVMGPARWDAMEAGVKFFLALLNAPIPRVAVENPVPHKWAMEHIVSRWNQQIQPWHFGDKQMKGTCLWLRGLPTLLPTTPAIPPVDAEGRKAWQSVWREPPGPDQAKNRSRTFPGIAEAMADQWGKLPDPTSLDSLLWASSRPT